MTGGEDESPGQVTLTLTKKSYKIADILRDSRSPSSHVEERQIEHEVENEGPIMSFDRSTIPSYHHHHQSPIVFDLSQYPLMTNGSGPSHHVPNIYVDHFPKDLSPMRSGSPPTMSTSSAEYTMSPLTSGPSPLLPFLSTHPPPPPPTFFQSPGYISLLLANHLAVQPYLHHHHRIPDFNAYAGRPIILGSKRKGGQVRFAAAQTARLEKEFLDHKYLHANDRKRLAQALKLTDRQVKTWFQNRRAKWRKVGVVKGHRSESHMSASYGTAQEKEGYSPDQGRSVSVSSIISDDSS